MKLCIMVLHIYYKFPETTLFGLNNILFTENTYITTLFDYLIWLILLIFNQFKGNISRTTGVILTKLNTHHYAVVIHIYQVS